jgi:hypothetical protein
MSLSTNLFLETSSLEKIIKNIKSGEWKETMDGLCRIKDNVIVLDNIYFKAFGAKETYNIILSHIINNIDSVLSTQEGFTVHINMKHLTIGDVDKHLKFIQHISGLFKEKYPNKLTKCFIHNAPFVFAKILNIVSLFIDKETQKKIELVTIK